MAPPELVNQAPECLRGSFGPELIAPYRSGKLRMAECLLGALEASQRQTFEIVEELERRGTLRFEPPRRHRNVTSESGVWYIAPDGESTPAS